MHIIIVIIALLVAESMVIFCQKTLQFHFPTCRSIECQMVVLYFDIFL